MQKVDYIRTTTATVPQTAKVNVNTAPTAYYECVDLATMANYIKQQVGEVVLEDALIESMIKAARYWIEEKTGVAIVRQTITCLLSDDTDSILDVRLPFSPVVLTAGNVTSINRVNIEGTKTLLTRNADYYVRGLSETTINLSRTWSTGALNGVNSQDVEIVYEAGYATLSDIPEPLRLAIMKLVAENYINRENSVDWGINMVPFDVIKLIGPFTRIYL